MFMKNLCNICSNRPVVARYCIKHKQCTHTPCGQKYMDIPVNPRMPEYCDHHVCLFSVFLSLFTVVIFFLIH